MSTSASFLLPAFVPPVASDGPGLTYNPNHEDEAASRLIAEFDSSAKLHALVRVLVAPLQELEQVALSVRDAFDVDTAEHGQIDLLGAFVGVLREGRSDIALRAYVRARILANASDGAGETILSIARALLGSGTLSLTYVPGWVDLQPAHFDLHVAAATIRFPWDPTGIEPPEIVARAVADAVALAVSAGVSFALFYQYTLDADALVFSSVGDAEEPSVTQGLADTSETGAGGALIGVETRY